MEAGGKLVFMQKGIYRKEVKKRKSRAENEYISRVLRWGVTEEVSPHQGKFDVAMCADW